MRSIKFGLVLLSISLCLVGPLQAAEPPVAEYERLTKPYWTNDVWGQIFSVCGIRSPQWYGSLAENQFKARLTNRRVQELERRLSGSELDGVSARMKKHQTDIYAVFKGNDLQSACRSIRDMPLLRKLDAIAAGS